MRIVVHKADATCKAEPIESMAIEISGELPPFKGKEWLTEAKKLYREDAKKIADALEQGLPGGTRHQLLCELLQRHEMLFRVPLES